MKLNIQKLQAGGGFGMLFSAVPSPAAVSTQSDPQQEQKSPELLSKETLNKLTEKGLPNEVEMFNNIVSNLQQKISFGQRPSSQEIANIRSLANRIVYNYNALENARKEIEKNGAYNDIAIDKNGYIYSLSQNGKVEKVHLSKYNPEQYQALTYGDLVNYRANDPNLVNDFETITSINSGTGLEKINNFISSILEKVGEAETKQEAYETLKSLTSTERPLTQEVYSALKAVAGASEQIGLEGIFKTKQMASNKNVEMALDYILKILPRNMRYQLQAEYVTQGGSYKDSNKYGVSVIQNAILMNNKSKYEFSIDYESSINSDKSGGSKHNFSQNAVEKWIDGDLNQTEVSITDPDIKNKYALNLKGSVMPQLTTTANHKIANMPMGEAINESIGFLIDHNNIYVGENKVNEGVLNSIAYTSDKLVQAELPVLQNGNIDWEGYKGAEKAEEIISQNPTLTIQQKNEIHSQYNSFMRYKNNGEIEYLDRTERFALTWGLTTGKYATDNDNTLHKEITGNDEDYAEALFERIFDNDKMKEMGIENPSSIWSSYYKVPIFMKLNQYATHDAYTYSGHGSYVPRKTLEEDMLTQNIEDKTPKQMYTTQDILYME